MIEPAPVPSLARAGAASCPLTVVRRERWSAAALAGHGAGGASALRAQFTVALNELVFIPWPPLQISKPASIDFR